MNPSVLSARLCRAALLLASVQSFQIASNNQVFYRRKGPDSFCNVQTRPLGLAMSAGTAAVVESKTVPTWEELKQQSAASSVGKALNDEVEHRLEGEGSAHVQNTLRKFGKEGNPRITLYRDHAGWCPYCQKTMLLVEEKQIPIKIGLVPMRSYGDKPREFLDLVPSGLLPALIVERQDGRKQVITESQVIMELLDQWHPSSDGYKPMLPSEEDDVGWSKVQELAKLERELFSWWCTLLFRPEGPRLNPGGIMGMLSGRSEESTVSGPMQGFLDCMGKVEEELKATNGPWFLDTYDHPTMIDFIYVSHVERMLASCAYWKGLDIRKRFPAVNTWLEAFEKREPYLAFKSDYYTHIKDIPPQYGPGYDGGFEETRKEFASYLTGKGSSWKLPLPHDDPLQPLYNGPPLPFCVLEAAGIVADSDGKYVNSDAERMAEACRQMAGWKLSGNGVKVSRFAARGGPQGSKNPRKSFGAELADPYANPDDSIRPAVDQALRIVCQGLLSNELESLEGSLHELENKREAAKGLAYLRDRIGVPRDLPLASARYMRAHLNWAIDILEK